MKTNQTVEFRLITDLIKRHDELEKQCDAFCKITGADYGSPLFTAMWRMFEGYVYTLSELINAGTTPRENWLTWYVWENHCGKAGLPASAGEAKMRPINNVEDLVKLIKQTNGTWKKEKHERKHNVTLKARHKS